MKLRSSNAVMPPRVDPNKSQVATKPDATLIKEMSSKFDSLRKHFDSSIDALKCEVEDLRSLKREMIDSMNSLKVEVNELRSMKSEMVEMKALLAERNLIVSNLEEELANVKNKCKKMENLIDDEDAYVRRESLIFSGSMVTNADKNENCSTFIRDKIKDKMRIILKPEDISVTHRLGAKPANQGPDTRPITVRFTRRDTKREILFTKRDNTDPRNALYVSESLTPKRRTIHYALRQIKRKYPEKMTGFNTLEGKVFAYTKTPRSLPKSRKFDHKHVINTHDALKDFCKEYIQAPLEDFLNQWNH